jgi:MFS family permease
MKGGAVRRLGVALVTTSAGAFPVFLTSALILQIAADLAFPVEKLGIAVGVYFAAGAATSAMMGRLAEYAGAAAALRMGGVLSSFCLLSIALVGDLSGLVACLFLGGVCNALCQPAANLYVTRAIARSRRGLALALKQSAIPAATLLGGLAVPLIALTIGWRWAFVISAAAAALTAMWVPSLDSVQGVGNGDGVDRAPRTAMLLLAATVGFGAAAAGCLASFAVAGAARIGIADASAGWLVAGGSALAVVTRVYLGYRADLRDGGHLLIVTWMLFAGGVGAIGLASSVPAVFVLAVPLVFAAGWGWPGLFNLAVVTRNSAAPGAATGFTQTGTYIGGAVGPMLFGLVADRVSWTAAWSLVPVFFLLATLAAVTARAELRSAR